MRYQVWQSCDLSETERALLQVIVDAWRVGQAMDREAAEFALVQQGHVYRDAHESYDLLLTKSLISVVVPPTSDVTRFFALWDKDAPSPQDGIASPTLAGLIELGDMECVSDLDAISRMTEVLRRLYHPERKQLSLDEVCDAGGLEKQEALRLAPLTGLYIEGEFKLGNEVLAWSTFDDVLRSKIVSRSPSPSTLGVARSFQALHLEFRPTVVSWSNLGPYKDAVLELSPLTVLIGANSSGKTSALRALALASRISERGLLPIDRDQREGPSDPASLDSIRDGAERLSFCVGGELRKQGRSWTQCQWSSELLLAPRVAAQRELFEVAGQRPRIELTYGIGYWPGEGGHPVDVHLRPSQLALLEATDARRHAEVIGLSQGLQGWKIVLEEMPMGQLLSLLETVELSRLEELLLAVFGALPSRRTPQWANLTKKRTRVLLASGGRGLQHVASVFAHLLQPLPPSLLALDEIENHLHADVAERLIEVLRSFTSRTRIILTTHSSNVLRAVSPGEVRLVRPQEDGSTIVRVDRDPTLSRLAQTGSMAELLEGGYLTGNT